MKEKELIVRREYHDLAKHGYGDCKSKKIFVWRKPLIHLKYCEEFSISEDFGCIYAEDKNDEMKCPHCGKELVVTWSGVKCSDEVCGYWFCY